MGIVTAAAHLGRIYAALNDDRSARLYLHQALSLGTDIQLLPDVVDVLVSVSALLAKAGDVAQALKILPLTLDHPAANPLTKMRAKALYTELLDATPAEVKTQAGPASTAIESIVADLLTEEGFLG